MVKDHSDSERGNLLPPHGLLFPIRVLLYAPFHRQDSTYHSLCYIVVEHWLEREIAEEKCVTEPMDVSDGSEGCT